MRSLLIRSLLLLLAACAEEHPADAIDANTCADAHYGITQPYYPPCQYRHPLVDGGPTADR